MKVLAIVEIAENGRIVSNEPEAVYMKNADTDTVTAFFDNTEKLHNQFHSFSQVKQNEIIRLDANFSEITKMGFVHSSELDKYFEKKIIEVENRVTIKFYLKYYLERPLKKYGLRFLAGIGGKFLLNKMKSK